MGKLKSNLEQVRALLKQAEVFKKVGTDIPSRALHINEGITWGLKYAAQLICEHPSTLDVTSPDGNVTLTTCNICNHTLCEI